MDQQKMWENNLKRNSKVENAIAVAGLKAALLVGEISPPIHLVLPYPHSNLIQL
jgi:hypothetical protein